MVGADLWSPAVVGVTFYNIESIECNKQNHREARFLVQIELLREYLIYRTRHTRNNNNTFQYCGQSQVRPYDEVSKFTLSFAIYLIY